MAQVRIEGARANWLSVFEAKEQQNGGHKFEGTFIVPKGTPEAKKLIDAQLAAAKETWGDNAVNVIKSLEKNRKVIRDGDTNTDDDSTVRDGYAGCHYFVAKSKTRPGVIDGKRTPLVQPDGKPYNGCYVNVIIDIYTVSKKEQGGKGIFCELIGVQFVRDGDSLGTGGGPRGDVAAMFDTVADDASAGANADDEVL